MTTATFKHLHEIENILSRRFFERSEVVRALVVSLLARQHVLMIGAPGSAKSALTRELASLAGLRYFEKLLTRFSTESELFGPPDLASLERGEYRRVVSGMLPEAELAFVDEIFKANSAVLNSLLSIINERVYHDGARVIKTPLLTMVGASNEYPHDDNRGEELAALFDRFMTRFHLDSYLKADNLEALLSQVADGSRVDLEDEIGEEELNRLRVGASEEIRSVAHVSLPTVPKKQIRFLVEIRERLAEQGVVISDRRMVQAVRMVQMNALYNGRSQVTNDDLGILVHAFWVTPDQRATVMDVVVTVARPVGATVARFKSQVNEILTQFLDSIDDVKDDDSQLFTIAKTATKQLKSMRERAVDELQDVDENAAQDLVDEIDRAIKTVQMKVLGA